jgi:hypothetical protein
MVDQTTTPADDVVADWEDQEPAVAERLGGYRRISLERVDYRGWEAADWEFTHGSTHVLNRNIRIDDNQAYALYWSVPDDEWAASRPIFDTVAATFQPAS